MAINPNLGAEAAYFDPNHRLGARSLLIAAAARGDVTAQRALFREAAGTAICGLKPDADLGRAPMLLALESLFFARLSASHGERQDVWDLAGALSTASHTMRAVGSDGLADQWASEAIGILGELTERGDPHAAEAATALIAEHSALIAVPQSSAASQGVH